MRIGLLHYSTHPAIGGIEQLLVMQAEALTSLGHEVAVVSGTRASGGKQCFLPLMDPGNPDVVAAGRSLCGEFPPSGHEVTERLKVDLGHALDGCDACWVHNALTLNLNPFLTMALLDCIEGGQVPRWVVWCEDVSSGSRFSGQSSEWPALPVRGAITYVALSRARAVELEQRFGIPPRLVLAVPAPLHPGRWLSWTHETRALVESAGVLEGTLMVLVPAKLLPHKGVDFAVEVCRELVHLGANPRMVLTAALSPHQPAVSHGIREGLMRMMSAHELRKHIILVPDHLGREMASSTMQQLMQLADVVFLPSHEEGFGIPVLEGLISRVPVLARDIPAFREAGGDAIHYFDPDATPLMVAGRVLALSSDPAAVARRHILNSWPEFQAALSALCRYEGNDGNTRRPE